MQHDDTQPFAISLSVTDTELLSTEIQDVHPRSDRINASVRASWYTALERAGGDAAEVLTDPAYAAGSILRAASALEALITRNVHRAAGYTAELLREALDLNDPQRDDDLLAHFVITSKTPGWTEAIREQ